MAYTVFLSHSGKDQWLTTIIANTAREFGVEILIAEREQKLGQHLDEKISNMIDKSNCVIALLTQNAIGLTNVNQEIGYAIKSGKPLIPFVTKGTPSEKLGVLLEGKEYIEYDITRPSDALTDLIHYVVSLKSKNDKDDQNNTLILVGLGALALLGLSSLGGEK